MVDNNATQKDVVKWISNKSHSNCKKKKKKKKKIHKNDRPHGKPYPF